MRKLSAQEAALLRMAMHEETKLLQEGNNNASPDVGAAYPRMMYRATTDEDRLIQTDAHAKCGETYIVQNRFHGFLCETIVAETADEAEALAAEGWNSTPAAAHGQEDGIAQEVSAKDAEIAELRRLLAERDAQPAPRRGRAPDTQQEELPSA